MRIVHLEDFIHPDAGYQVNLLSRIQQRDGHQVFIVTAELDRLPAFITEFFGKEDILEKDRRFERETGVKIFRIPALGYYSGRAIFRPDQLLRAVSSFNPDVVMVHGEDTLTGMMSIASSGVLPFPIVLDCHSLEMASVNPYKESFRTFYKHVFTPIILKRKIPLIRVVDSDFVEKCLGIPLSHTILLSFGTDTSYFQPDPDARLATRQELGIGEDVFLVMYAGKLDESKGGAFLAESLRGRLPVESRPVEFLVIGNGVGAYGQEVNRVLASSENRIIRLPTQRYFDLARYYQAADLVVFPRQCSLSFFEAQSCGLPVLFEDNEINVQRISGRNAVLFRPGDVQDFRSKIVELASMPPDSFEEMRGAARGFVLKNYDYVPIAREFTRVLSEAASGFQKKNLGSRVVSLFRQR
jgi:glycosyltransferase involved in cell wall biosynthesis